MLNPYPDLLLRIAMADAYAMSCEYIKHPRDDSVLQMALEFKRYIKHPTHTLKAGHYTDDTQLSIAVAEALIDDAPLTRGKFTKAFVTAFCRDPRDGYARGFQKLLDHIKNAHSPYHEFIKMIIPTSTKNGACMRAVPLGVIRDIPTLLEVAKVQASVTHNTAEGIWSSQAIALMSHFALHRSEPMSDLGNFLLSNLPSQIVTIPLQIMPSNTIDVSTWTKLLVNGKPWNAKVTNRIDHENEFYGVAIATVRACYSAILLNNNFIDVMKQVLLFGGDTDSVAALACSIASIRANDDLNGFWIGGLEPGSKYGVSFLKNLGKQLMDKYQ